MKMFFRWILTNCSILHCWVRGYWYREFRTTTDRARFVVLSSEIATPMHFGTRISIINADITCHDYFWKKKRKKKKRETFCVAGGGYNKNVGREKGRRETGEDGEAGAEEWEKAGERESTHVLVHLYNYRRSAGRGEGVSGRVESSACANR